MSYHVFSRYVKVTFLNGASLDPVPPGGGNDPDSRWVDIYEDKLDGEQNGGMGSGVVVDAGLGWVPAYRLATTVRASALAKVSSSASA